MSPWHARLIADEQIAWWRSDHMHNRLSAQQAWAAMSSDRYPGGGWERVRALMVGWLLANETQDELRRAA